VSRDASGGFIICSLIEIPFAFSVSSWFYIFPSSLSVERYPFSAKNQTPRSYRVYISPTK